MTDPSSASPLRPDWQPEARSGRLFLLPVVMVLLAAGLLLWQLPSLTAPRTNNAYVRGNITQIAAEIAGRITEVLVSDYERVRQGDLLARIDDRIPKAHQAEASAALAYAVAALSNNDQAMLSGRAALGGQEASLASANAQLVLIQSDAARTDDLVARKVLPARSSDASRAALASASAAVEQAKAEVEIARQKLAEIAGVRSTLEAEVAVARAQLQAAEVQLADTYVRAPVSGQLGEVGMREGEFVSAGTVLVVLVPEDRWIIANFKEAQIASLIPGQAVTIHIDALGAITLRGRIERLSPATGSEFALLKPDNATGNFVKVPQRVGVRIAFDQGQPEVAGLAPGLSAQVTIGATSD